VTERQTGEYREVTETKLRMKRGPKGCEKAVRGKEYRVRNWDEVNRRFGDGGTTGNQRSEFQKSESRRIRRCEKIPESDNFPSILFHIESFVNHEIDFFTLSQRSDPTGMKSD